MQISQINSTPELNFVYPAGFSFFEPYLTYHFREILEIGGEVYNARAQDGSLMGIFIYDNCEKGGTI
jgi:hypothetical protein